MFCQNCGKEIENTALFCPFCGSKNEPLKSEPANKTQAFVNNRNAEKGVVSNPVPEQGGNRTQNFINSRQALTDNPAQPSRPVAPNGMQGIPQANNGYTPAPQYAPQKPQKKGMPVWAIILIIVGALAIIGTVSTILVRNYITKKLIPSVSKEFEIDLDDLFDATTKSENEQSTEKETDKKVYDSSTVGKPQESDFNWYKGVMQGFPKGAKILTKSEDINGRWKAMNYIEGGVKELDNIEIAAGDRAVTVTIEPYMINYDGYEWNDSSDVGKYSYEGNIDSGTITCFSDKYGSISLYAFYELDGKQYAYGNTMLQSGETVEIALVR